MAAPTSAALVRSAVVMLVVLATLVGTAPPAAADAAGPTDYRTDIVSIEPADAPIEVKMIGGDSFVHLTQLEPVEIVVIGYRNEPYLRFDPDGTVVENRRSPTTWANEERYGTTEDLPTFVDHEAPPQWKPVGSGGAYAWHDHRSHWMNPVRPLGAEPGDQVLEDVVLLRIDGAPATITVASFLLEDPPIWPAILGGLAAIGLAAIGLGSGRLALTLSGLAVAALALALGAIAFNSVPSETEPSTLLWLLPLVAAIALLIVALVRNRLATSVYLDGLAVVAGVTLGAWSITRFDALTRALIPSSAPAALDRLTIVAAVVIAIALASRGFYGLARPQRLIDPAPIP